MKVLVANRGEIACRIIATLRELGHTAVAVYTEHDADAPHVALADEAVLLHGELGYLDIQALVHAATERKAAALHPGYGFASQSPKLVRASARAGVTFIGCSEDAMHKLGNKDAARKLAREIGIPVVPGAGAIATIEEAEKAADTLGYPVLLKSANGGGGRGMRRVRSRDEMRQAFAAATREAAATSTDNRLLLEKYLCRARHIEVQILGDAKRAMTLGERECSLQRRYQKIIEESPAAISEEVRLQVTRAAIRLAEAAGYSGAGTVEFLITPESDWYFLEVNTRLQVEHPVTECVFGHDIVRAQIELAFGAALPAASAPRGHAIEARLNAEDPYRGFTPETGSVLLLDLPHLPGVRIDAGVRQGSIVSPHYDSLLAKVIAHGETRAQARTRLIAALEATTLLGVVTNQSFLLEVLRSELFQSAETYTDTIESRRWSAPEIPAYARKAALHAVFAPSGETRARDLDPRISSPWQALGAFRLGA